LIRDNCNLKIVCHSMFLLLQIIFWKSSWISWQAPVVERYDRPMPKLRNTKPDSGRYEEKAVAPGTLNVAQLRHIILMYQGKADDHEGPMNIQQIAEKFQLEVAQVQRILQFLSLPPEDNNKQKSHRWKIAGLPALLHYWQDILLNKSRCRDFMSFIIEQNSKHNYLLTVLVNKILYNNMFCEYLCQQILLVNLILTSNWHYFLFGYRVGNYFPSPQCWNVDHHVINSGFCKALARWHFSFNDVEAS